MHSDCLLPADVSFKKYETEADAPDWAVAEMINLSDVFVRLFRQYPIRTVFSQWFVPEVGKLSLEKQQRSDPFLWLLMSSLGSLWSQHLKLHGYEYGVNPQDLRTTGLSPL